MDAPAAADPTTAADAALAARLATDLDGSFEALVSGPRRTGCSRSRCASSATAATPRRLPRTRSSGRTGRSAATTPARIRELRLRPWLTTIVVNVCRNRTRVRRVPDDRAGLRARRRAGRRPGRAARRPRRRGRASWPTLPPAQRIAVVLRHVDGLSYAEMAEALGRPEGTLKAQVHRGLAAAARSAPRRRAATTARR